MSCKQTPCQFCFPCLSVFQSPSSLCHFVVSVLSLPSPCPCLDISAGLGVFTSLVLLLARVDLLFPVPIRFIISSLNTLSFVDFLFPRPCLALYLPTPASSDSHSTWSAAPTPDIFQPLLQLYCFRSQPWQENWLKWTLKANRKEVSSHLNDVKSILPEQAYRM